MSVIDDLFGKSSTDWEPIATFPATSTDGHAATVEVWRCPARFYRVRVAGQPYEITTGSGDKMKALAYRLAGAIAGGIIAFHPAEV